MKKFNMKMPLRAKTFYLSSKSVRLKSVSKRKFKILCMVLSTFLEKPWQLNPQFRVSELRQGTTVIMQESEICEKGKVWQAQQVGLLCHVNRKGSGVCLIIWLTH